MEMRFLLAVDMTPASAHMLRYVFELNRYFFARLELLHVFDMPVAAVGEDSILIRGQDTIQKAVEQELWSFLEENRGNLHFDTTVSAVSGGYYNAVAARAVKWPADLIITGHIAQERSSFWTSSGTGRHLLTHPPVPVLSIPEHAGVPPQIKNILICTDLSTIPNPDKLMFLKKFATALGASLHLLHVKVPHEIEWKQDEAVREAWKKGLGIPLSVLEHPGQSSLTNLLAEYAGKHGIDMLVVFPHAHNWIYEQMMGSETRKIFDQVELPLLSLPLDRGADRPQP